jgi:hypothetical protein
MAKSIQRDAPWLRRIDVDQMLYELAPHRGERRLILFACACCRLAWPLLHADARRTVEVFELFADGRVGRRECSTRPPPVRDDTRPAALWAAEAVSALREWFAGPYDPLPEAGLSAEAAGVRELSGRLQAAGLVADHGTLRAVAGGRPRGRPRRPRGPRRRRRVGLDAGPPPGGGPGR